MMLSWSAGANAQSIEGQSDNQDGAINKLVQMLSQMTEDEKAYARKNWLVAPKAYTKGHEHPASYIIAPNPAPDTQNKVECAGCSSAYLLRFYGEDVNGVQLYHQPSFPCKYDGGAYPRCFKVFFEEQNENYTTEYYSGTTDDLKNAVSQGVPVIVLLVTKSKTLHYVPVVGYDESHFYIQDSVEKYRNVSNNDNYNEMIDIPTFDAMWNIPIEGCQRLFVIVRRTS